MFERLKFSWLLVAMAALTAPLTACHTVEGVGQDVEAAGDAMEDSARETRDY